MGNKIFNKKWYLRLLQIIFWCLFIFFIVLGIWGLFYEDDMPLVAFFYAGILAIAYGFIRKIFH
jgi:4-hydroxybenzoate polyprenyltransferase